MDSAPSGRTGGPPGRPPATRFADTGVRKTVIPARPKNFSAENFSAEKFFGRKIFGRKIFGRKLFRLKNFWPKKFSAEKFSAEKFSAEKCSGRKIFGRNFFGQSFFGRKLFRPKIFRPITGDGFSGISLHLGKKSVRSKIAERVCNRLQTFELVRAWPCGELKFG